MKRNELVIFGFLAVVLWFAIAWYWYVCGIRGACEQNMFATDTSVKQEINKVVDIPVEERDNIRVNSERVGSNKQSQTTVTQEEIVISCDNYLDSYIRLGYNNSARDVERLEKFLNNYEDENLNEDGLFSKTDQEAVKRFQTKYRAQILDPWGMTNPSGHVYQTTRDHVNALHCAHDFTEKNQ